MSFQLVIGQPAPASSSATGAIRTGYVEEDGIVLPSDTTAEIWIKGDSIWGNQGGQQYESTDECGDDDGAGTEADPIRTLKELERRLHNGFGNGCHVKVYLMGHGGPDFDHPTEGRLYYARDLRISYGNGSPESYRSTITYIGPRGMLTQAGPYKLASATDVTNSGRRIGKTRLAFTQGGVAATVTAATYQMRWLRADGREALAPFGVEKNVNDGSVHASVMSAETFNLSANLVTDNWYVVIPAVCVAADGLDTQFRGVNICGAGPYRIGDRVSAHDPVVDKNPWPHIERVAFAGRTTVSVVGELWADNCNFRDHITVGPHTAMRARNCCIEGLLNYNGQATFRTNSSQLDPRIEPSCRMLEYDDEQGLDEQRNTLTSDPDNAVTGQDWSIAGQGAGVIVGEDVGGFPASLRVLKGIAMNCESGVHAGFKVYGGSSLWIANASRVCVTMLEVTDIGFWGVDGSKMRINDGPVVVGVGGIASDLDYYAGPCVYGTALDVKVGNETPVAFGSSAGQLRYASGLNGNFVSDYDYSRAWTPSSEPTGYGKAGAG